MFVCFVTKAQDPSSEVVGSASHIPELGRSFNPFRYSTGFVLGVMPNPSAKAHYVVWWTLEGEMRLGPLSTSTGSMIDRTCLKRYMETVKEKRNTVEYQMKEFEGRAKCTIIDLSPWYFSGYHWSYAEKLQLKNDYVVLHYSSYHLIPIVNSNNYFLQVIPTDPSILHVGDRFPQNAGPASFLKEGEHGVFDGHIVKASLDGTIRNGYSIAIQIANAGDQYEQLNVTDSAMFDFVVKAMVSGRYVRVGYNDFYNYDTFIPNFIHGYKTDYRPYQIEILDPPTNYPTAPQP
jgi:hypothetical protein